MDKRTPHDEPDQVQTDDRSMCARWVVQVEDDGTEVQAKLDVHHFGAPSYRYQATLRNVKVSHERGFRCERIAISLRDSTDVRLTAVPAKRFGRKTLEKVYDGALAELRERADENGVALIFNGQGCAPGL